MRYIPLEDKIPEQVLIDKDYTLQQWIEKANILLEKLKSAPNETARNKIIDDNKEFWGKLKKWLLRLSDQKCWFSEAKDCSSYLHVEHFRPKKDSKELDGKKHCGYWWLAFNWQNFRICGSVVNTKKGTFFPLQDESKRVLSPDGDLRYEFPLLLDPANPYDPGLLYFNMEGRAIPHPSITSNWERDRVVRSVERYNLDFPALMDKRKTVWNDCWKHIQDYLQELEKLYEGDQDNPMARCKLASKADAIKKLTYKDKEFSAVARACVLSTGDPRVTRLLQSA
jgi:uncharacterized protein (TIGR02646 family)